MSSIARYGMLSGAAAGTIAAIIGILLFNTFLKYSSSALIAVFFGAIFALAAVITPIIWILVLPFWLLGGVSPIELFIEILRDAFTAFSPLLLVGYFEEIGYSLSISSINPYFAILMVIAGIIIAVGFFSKYSVDGNAMNIVSGIFGIAGIAGGGILLYLALQPISNYILSLISIPLAFTAITNYTYINLAAVLLLVGFLIFGITHLRGRHESMKPTLCTGIGIMEILTGVILLGGILSVTMFIIGFASMLITFVLWIPYGWSEYRIEGAIPKKAPKKGPKKGVEKWEG
ncbi:MAG: hypothetical protein ACETWM_02150 [Candidatus Lokiarchaeia archaeon]